MLSMEVLSRLIPNADCRVILVIRHPQIELANRRLQPLGHLSGVCFNSHDVGVKDPENSHRGDEHRGANSFVIQQAANIFREFGHSTMRCRVRESRSIAINKDE